MLEDSLMSFLECDGSRARLLYELSLSFDGFSQFERDIENGIIQQHHPKTLEICWMKLVDLPAWRKESFLSFEREVGRRFQGENSCSVDVFEKSLNNLALSSQLCRPFALVCGNSRDQVQSAANVLKTIELKYQDNVQCGTLTKDPAVSGDRAEKVRADRLGALSTESAEKSIPLPTARAELTLGGRPADQPQDAPPELNGVLKVTRSQAVWEPPSAEKAEQKSHQVKRSSSRLNDDESMNEATIGAKGAGKNEELACKMTVPLWVMQKCTRDEELFRKLFGFRFLPTSQEFFLIVFRSLGSAYCWFTQWPQRPQN